jgi:nucleoside-diphosphate-sugar epimerase
MIIWLLGASGFIGSNFSMLSAGKFNLIAIPHLSPNLTLYPNPDVIINLAASEPNANEIDSMVANLRFPSEILNYVKVRSTKPFKWLQIGSYFELQIPLGRSDFYSIHKAQMREKLSFEENAENINVTSLILPHVFGPGQKPNRLIPASIEAFRSGKTFRTSPGEQFLPIIHVDDAITAILSAVDSSQILCSASPVWYGKVKELLSLIRDQLGYGTFLTDTKLASIDTNFPRVEFPPPVINWSPLKDLSSLVS